MTRAKFKIDSIERTLQQHQKRGPDGLPLKNAQGGYVYAPVEMWTLKGSPVYANSDPNHENSKFWSASPSGSLVLGTVNAEAVKEFELGREIYLDISLAPIG